MTAHPHNRAGRRHIRETLIARVRRIARDFWDRGGWNSIGGKRESNWAEKSADHPNDCKHWWCRSPRKWAKGDSRLTFRERKQHQEETEI